MNKAGKIGLGLLIAGTLAASAGVYAYHQSEAQAQAPLIFSPLEGRTWVEACVQQHPEILWLAESGVRKTEEGHATCEGSYSEQLFGKKYIEFDRTIMSLHCLRLVLDGSDKAYETFTAAQPQDVKLTRESFHELHLQGQKILKSKWHGLTELQMAQTMETALVLGDIGKSEKARELFKPHGITAPDHDDFAGDAMQVLAKHPALCPSFKKLPPQARALLQKVTNQAHFGHFTHTECGPKGLRKLEESRIASEDPVALDFDLFEHTCDVAAALGMVNNSSSLVYNQPTHRAMQAMASAVRVMADPSKSALDAYNSYLEARATWLGLNARDSSDRVLTRIGAMVRLFTPADGVVLRQGMGQLDPSVQNRISAQLDITKEEMGRTPTYMPAVLVNLTNNQQLGATKEARLSKAIVFGLPFLSRVLEVHKQLMLEGKISPDIPLNFNQMAGIAKTSPEFLNGDVLIDQEGNVTLAPITR